MQKGNSLFTHVHQFEGLALDNITLEKRDGLLDHEVSGLEDLAVRKFSNQNRSYHIYVKNLCLEWQIGVYDHEQNSKQLLTIDIDLMASLRGDWQDDCYENVPCYDSIVKSITALSHNGHVNLLESLAFEIAELCLENKKIQSAKVLINKPQALAGRSTFGDAMVGVEVICHQQP